MSSNSQGLREEVLDIDGSTSRAEGCATKRPKQKSVLQTKDLVLVFSRSGDVMEDFCAGTYTKAKACMLPDPQRKVCGMQCKLWP